MLRLALPPTFRCSAKSTRFSSALQSSIDRRQQQQQQSQHRCFHRTRLAPAWSERGHDLVAEMMAAGGTRPKVIFEGYTSCGFEVHNMVKNMSTKIDGSGLTHMHGSILAFPHGCFLWNVERAKDVTIESLAPVALHHPKIEMLILGVNDLLPDPQTFAILRHFEENYGIAVEKTGLGNAMGTFNFLNLEDREVAVALVVDKNA